MHFHLLPREYCYLLAPLLLDTAEGNLPYIYFEVNPFTTFVAEKNKIEGTHLQKNFSVPKKRNLIPLLCITPSGNVMHIIYIDIGGYSEKAVATHSSTFAWRIPGTEEPVGLPSIGVSESDTTDVT